MNTTEHPINPAGDPTTPRPVPTTHEKLVLTVTEAAELLGISRGLAYELVRMGAIPSLRLGRRLLVPRVRLEELLASGEPR